MSLSTSETEIIEPSKVLGGGYQYQGVGVGDGGADHCQLRLDCLRLAVEIDTARAIDLAERYTALVLGSQRDA